MICLGYAGKEDVAETASAAVILGVIAGISQVHVFRLVCQ